MKSKLLSMPVIGILGKIVPAPQRKTVVGSLFALKFIPAWALSIAVVGFLWSMRSKSRESNQPAYQ
jgi:hypothetical protein